MVGKIYLYMHYPAADFLCNLDMRPHLSIMFAIQFFVRLITVIYSMHMEFVIQVRPNMLAMVPEPFTHTLGHFGMIGFLQLAPLGA